MPVPAWLSYLPLLPAAAAIVLLGLRLAQLHTDRRRLRKAFYKSWEGYLEAAATTIERLRGLRASLDRLPIPPDQTGMSAARERFRETIAREILEIESQLDEMSRAPDSQWYKMTIRWRPMANLRADFEHLLEIARGGAAKPEPEEAVAARYMSGLRDDLTGEEIAQRLGDVERDMHSVAQRLSESTGDAQASATLDARHAWLTQTRRWWSVLKAFDEVDSRTGEDGEEKGDEAARLRHENRDLNARLKNAEGLRTRIAELEQQVRDLLEEKQQLTMQLETAATAGDPSGSLRAALAEEEGARRNAEDQLARYAVLLGGDDGDLALDPEQWRKQFDEMNQRMLGARDAESKAREKVEQMQREMDMLLQQVDAERDNYAHARKEADRMRQILDEGQMVPMADMEKLQGAYDKLNVEVLRLKTGRDQAEKEASQVLGEYTNLQRRFDEKCRQVDRLRDDLESTREGLEQAQTREQKARKRTRTPEEPVEPGVGAADVEKLRSELAAVRKRHERENLEHEQVVRMLEQSLEQQTREAEGAIRSLEKDLQAKNEEIHRLHRALSRHEEDAAAAGSSRAEPPAGAPPQDSAELAQLESAYETLAGQFEHERKAREEVERRWRQEISRRRRLEDAFGRDDTEHDDRPTGNAEAADDNTVVERYAAESVYGPDSQTPGDDEDDLPRYDTSEGPADSPTQPRG